MNCCPYCGAEVVDENPWRTHQLVEGVSGRTLVRSIGLGRPTHEACVKWLERRPDWGATTTPVRRIA